ncbi:RNA polymerase sigma factor [Sporosarcina sp. Te-1]|uniref:RNA polymerase sigma factor n=1 Tax=Sporosarcina sp. Te-1 TaxID=2818390 RepID=UPI001A9D69CC|nr:RNA polymerase sigma factor [Sporosarcina sp. Te-1]QTD40404.1 RNA polymerase sigma factor [Sporosarcina sp. Te-1]
MLKKVFADEQRTTPEVEKIIFEKYYDRVYHTAYFIVKDPEMAQDILQESYLKAFRNIHLIHEIEKIGAWLTTITTRTAIDHLRKMKRWNDFAADDVFINRELLQVEQNPISSVETAAERKLIRSLLQGEIDKLNTNHRIVLFLYYFDDLTYEEISEALDVNIATVKTRVHRAKLKLRAAIEKKEELMEAILDVGN